MTDRLPPVLSGGRWQTNGELIAEVCRLHVKPTDRIIDVTFGRGLWWTDHEPPPELFIGTVRTLEKLTAFEGHPLWGSLRILPDFRDMRAATNDYAEVFDAGFFDPAYVSKGGRKTSGIPEMDDRYGIGEPDETRSPRELHEYNMVGLRELVKVVKPGGLICEKVMDYTSSGQLQLGTHWLITDALALGLKVHDRFRHIGDPGPQPTENLDGTPRRQVRSRQNVSELIVFRTPRRRKSHAD